MYNSETKDTGDVKHKVQRITFGAKKPQSKNEVPTLCAQTPSENVSSTRSIINNLPTILSFGLKTEVAKMNDKSNDNMNEKFLRGTYKDDYNILEIDELIKKRLTKNKEEKIKQFELKREQEQHKLTDNAKSQTIVERKNCLMRIDSINKDIENLTNDTALKKYLNEVETIIAHYKDLGPIPKVISFKSQNKSEAIKDPLTDTQLYRYSLIDSFLSIARNYIDINVIRENNVGQCCLGCGSPLNDSYIEELGILNCPDCGMEREHLTKQPFYKDTTRVNTSSRNNYDDRDNFLKAILRFQGKQPNRFPTNLFSTLDAYFKAYGLSTGEDIKMTKELDDRGRRVGTDKDLMYKALHDTGNALLYEDINLLCHLYWGWLLPDISSLEELIMDDYDKSQRVYERLKLARTSCLNTQYRLFKHLQLRGYPCRADDFKIVKTRDILETHERIWYLICKELSWPFYET